VPKVKGVNATDDRELGLMVYHLYVGEADKLGNVRTSWTGAGQPARTGRVAGGRQGSSPRPGAKPAVKASPKAAPKKP